MELGNTVKCFLFEEVSKHYDDDEPDYDLDELDNQIWDSIGKFTTVCEQFYFDNGEPK